MEEDEKATHQAIAKTMVRAADMANAMVAILAGSNANAMEGLFCASFLRIMALEKAKDEGAEITPESEAFITSVMSEVGVKFVQYKDADLTMGRQIIESIKAQGPLAS